MGLGRGLSSLLGEDAGRDQMAARARLARDLPIEVLRPNRNQPRHKFDDQRIAELVTSVRDRGVLQPLIVRPLEDEPGEYEIIAGERRWRAAQRAGLHEVPVIIKQFNDSEALEVALVENIQRQDLTPIEEANGYRRLIDQFGHNQERLGAIVGKSRSHVANMLRLLTLPERVQDMLNYGMLSMGHARALITADDPLALARAIVEGGLNVRQAEEMARQSRAGAVKPVPRPRPQKSPDTLALEKNLGASLGLQVIIEDKGDKGGRVRITYRTLEQLDEICRRLSRHGDSE